MFNFSQSINSSHKGNKQKPNVPFPLSFKIAPPKCQHLSRQMTTQQSFNVCPDTTNSILHKNMTRSYSREKIEDQYISFKLKPTKQNRQQNPVRITKQKPSAISSRQVPDFYFAHFDESQQYQKKNSMSELSKSPEFFCKPNSIDSIKESFEEQKQVRDQNKKSYRDQNSFCKMMNESEEFQALKKYEHHPKQYQDQSKKQKLNLQKNFQEDSVIYDNFQDLELYTPYKQLKEQFQRQEKLYEKEVRLNYLQQFDSFNEKNANPFKNIPINFDRNQGQLKSRDNQVPKNPTQKSETKLNKQASQSTEKNSFFFLTNPVMESNTKYVNPTKPNQPQQQNQLKKEIEQKPVQQFCFSLSSIKLTTENSLQQPYANKNLFSNSNDQLFLFESKNGSRQLGSFGGSKKVHIKQLVQEFVDQLDNLDENSLNERNVHELEDVLESIVFKEPKSKRQPILIQEDAYSARTRSPIVEPQTRKWQKVKRQNSSDIATERKPLSQFQNFENRMIHQKRQSQYAFAMSSSNKKLSDRKYAKSPTSSHKSPSVGKENSKKQSVYKPNFALYKSREQKHVSQDKNKQNQKVCTAFTHLKQKHQASPININPKSSVYVRKGAKSSRQHLRTEAQRSTGWRVY